MSRILAAIVATSFVIQLFAAHGFAEQLAAGSATIHVETEDWPWWRGPTRDGVAAAGQSPPMRWTQTENVAWKTPVPGRGHGSPTVVGNQIFLATADEQRQVQSVICFDRNSGKQIWRTDVHTGNLVKKGNTKTSHASCTVACDGQQLFVNFLNAGAVHTTSLNREGNILWKKKIDEYVVHQGYGSSPALYGPLVLVTADTKAGGAIAALDRQTGKLAWKHARPKTPNYPSPIILRVAGRDQLVLAGCDRIVSFEPLSGKSLWDIEGATTECVATIVTDGIRVFSSGGFPKNHISAVRADGSGDVEWENNVRVYVPSMLMRDGHLYAVTDAGVAMCWVSETGERKWQGRLGGTFSASPVLVNDTIFATNEAGQTFIIRADPKAFELIARNQLGDEVFASAAICGSRIYTRVAHHGNDGRTEMLYCLGGAE